MHLAASMHMSRSRCCNGCRLLPLCPHPPHLRHLPHLPHLPAVQVAAVVLAGAGPLAENIPLPALSAVLVIVAVNMGEWHNFTDLPKCGYRYAEQCLFGCAGGWGGDSGWSACGTWRWAGLV